MTSTRLDKQADNGIIPQDGLHRLPVYEGPDVRIVRVAGTLERPLVRMVHMQPGESTLTVSTRGTAFLHDGLRNKTPIYSYGGVYILGHERTSIHYGRGKHNWIEWHWHHRGAEILSAWLQETLTRQQQKGRALPFSLSTRPQIERDLLAESMEATTTNRKDLWPLLGALALRLVSVAATYETTQTLSTAPKNVPKTLTDLMEMVRREPTREWSLKDGSDAIGWSPFHLSRTFRQVMGYGFPEFVDRIRAERSVDDLMSNDKPLLEVATANGFSTIHAMREVLKDSTGFLPKELRSLSN